MKRPHRRIHLIAWAILAPSSLAAAAFFWSERPATPYADPPAVLQKNNSTTE